MLSKIVLLVLLLTSLSARADKDLHESQLAVKAGNKELRFSGYFDGYYANDFNNPIDAQKDLDLNANGGRQFTSNPLYDKQFSIGYGFLQVEYEYNNVGFRLAHHFGDIVQKMYISEPERLKNIREASVTIRFNHELFAEIGYLPSIYGFETFINKDNLHAHRIQMTDFAPDYDAGVRLYWKKSEHEVIKFQVTNGWQVMRDTNKSQAVGGAYVYEVKGHYQINWGQFFGDEAVAGLRTSYRYYNNLFAKIQLNDKWIIAPMLDIGWEQKVRPGSVGKSWIPWQSYAFSARYALHPKHGLAARVDRIFDPNCIIPELKVQTNHGWISNGMTLTYEYLLNKNLTYRIEGRYLKTRDKNFRTSHANKFRSEEAFLMSQVAMSF